MVDRRNFIVPANIGASDIEKLHIDPLSEAYLGFASEGGFKLEKLYYHTISV